MRACETLRSVNLVALSEHYRYAGGDCVMDQDEWVEFCRCELDPNSRDPQRVERYRRDFAELVEKERTPSARERRLITLDSTCALECSQLLYVSLQ